MTPLERAARALMKSQDGLPTEKPADWTEEMWLDEQQSQQTIEDETWPEFVDDVRAVLAAIREPSEGMVCAHIEAEDCFDDRPRQAIVDWQAMIDQALAEGE